MGFYIVDISQAYQASNPSSDHVMKEEDIGSPLIRLQPKVEDKDFSSLDFSSSDCDDECSGKEVGARKEVDRENVEVGTAYPD